MDELSKSCYYWWNGLIEVLTMKSIIYGITSICIGSYFRQYLLQRILYD